MATVVQAASGEVVGTSLAITFGSDITPGNSVMLALSIIDFNTGSYSTAVTLGSSPDNWVMYKHGERNAGTDEQSYVYAGCWADLATELEGETEVTITLTGASGGELTSIIAHAWEVNGPPSAIKDVTGSGIGLSTAWGTGSFGPTAQGGEFWLGCASFSGNASVTGPSGWTCTSLAVTATDNSGMAGYQLAASAGSPDYAGTMTGAGEQWAAAAVTFQSGTASATADMSGAGTLAAAGGPAASASLSGAGTLAAAGISAPPDSAALGGAGELAAEASVTIEATAAMSGAGTLQAYGTPPTEWTVANQWAGTITQNPLFGPSLPGLAEIALPLTPATSVGGGSGLPSAGSWLFALCGWRQAPGAPPATVNVGDDTHSWWRPAVPSEPSGLTRATCWYTANAGQVTTAPAWVYVAPNSYTAGMAVLVIEVAGIGTWDLLAGIAAAYDAATGSLSMTVTL